MLAMRGSPEARSVSGSHDRADVVINRPVSKASTASIGFDREAKCLSKPNTLVVYKLLSK